jgi:hypothetical protein
MTPPVASRKLCRVGPPEIHTYSHQSAPAGLEAERDRDTERDCDCERERDVPVLAERPERLEREDPAKPPFWEVLLSERVADAAAKAATVSRMVVALGAPAPAPTPAPAYDRGTEDTCERDVEVLGAAATTGSKISVGAAAAVAVRTRVRGAYVLVEATRDVRVDPGARAEGTAVTGRSERASSS